MSRKTLAVVAVFCFGLAVHSVGFAGSTTTNDWFDASFTSLAVDTAIETNTTTGITFGAGSWTSVPTNGTATIVADADAGEGATCLSLRAPGEELTLTPAPFSATTGLETVSVQLKADAMDELPAIGAGVQAAFTVYLDESDVLSAAGWTSGGWTNLVYSNVGALTNAWATFTVDFKNVGSVRYVRYSVKPASGSPAVLGDSAGTTWFQAGANAETISSVSLSGTGSVRAIDGDSLEVTGVATYNGVGYDTFAEAIAAGKADNFAAGAVTLLSDASWTPAATGDYEIDVNGHELTINGVNGTWSGMTYTVPATHWYWIGGASGSWNDGANWSHVAGGAAAGAYPGASGGATTTPTDYAFINTAATITLASPSQVFVYGVMLGADVKFTGGGDLFFERMGGTGKVSMDGIVFRVMQNGRYDRDSGKMEITNDVEVCSGSTNTIKISASSANNYAQTATLWGGLKGAGELALHLDGNTSREYQRGLYFRGDNGDFQGVVVCTNALSNGSGVFGSTASSRNAAWHFNSVVTDGRNRVARGAGETYYFGSLFGMPDFNGNSTASDQTHGITIVVGGRNENCEFGGRICRSGYPNYLVKEGTADCVFTGSNIYTLDVQGGTFLFGSGSPFLSSGYIKFSGGAVSLGEGVSINLPQYFSSESTAAAVFDDRGRDNTWGATLNDSRVPFGFVKKGAGTLTLTTAPTHTTKTTIEDGVLVVPQGTTIAELSLVDGKLVVPLTGTEDETTVLTVTALAEGTDFDALTNAVAVVGTTMAVESDGGSGYIVKATRNPQTFTWTGAADTLWGNAANWTVGGVVAYTAPLAIDTAVVDAQAEISLAATASISNLTLNAQTTFSGGQIMNVSEIAGTGLMRMEGIQIRNTTTTTLNFTNNIEVVAGTSNEFAVVTDNKNNVRNIEIYGNITGTGHLTLRSRHSNNYYGVRLYGNNMDFAGEIYVYPYISDGKTDRNNSYIDIGVASSSNAVWEVYNSGGAHSFVHNGATAYFGALSGKVNQLDSNNHSKPTFEIGALPGLTSVLGGTYSRTAADRCSLEGATIRKVGETSVLKFSGVRAKQYQLNAGLFVLDGDPSRDYYLPADGIVFGGGTLRVDASNVVEEAVSYADPSAKIVNSASAIKIEVDGCVTQTWATALAASNVGGLVKKGEGTLVLSAAPAYTGTTYLDGGVLKMPVTKRVRTNAEGKHVVRSFETVDDVTYTVYTLADGDAPLPTVLFLK